jgi:hypothetical protein
MPKVSYAAVSSIKPDRLEDAIESARQANKLVGRHGADGRLLIADLAGEQTGTGIFVIQLDSVELAADLVASLDGDSEFTEFRVNLGSSKSPIVPLSTSMSVEIPLPGDLPQGRGSVIEVHLTKPVPGRFEQSLAESAKAASLMGKAGAVNIQAFQMLYAGAQTGTLGMAVEWPDTRSQVLSSSIWATDPIGQELAAASMNGTLASTLLSSALYREIPL